VPARVGIADGPRHDVRYAGELVVAAGAPVRHVGGPDVAYDEAVLDPVDARRPAYSCVVLAEGSERVSRPLPSAGHQRLA
jgi:hypothetical protein